MLKYLARYTHRVAIANSRLLSMEDGHIRFRWKDYARGSRQRVMTLEASEFIRRFLLHVMPRRFVRIRYFGFMANRCRAASVARCRQLLTASSTAAASNAEASPSSATKHDESACCPACRQGRMRIESWFDRRVAGVCGSDLVFLADTS